MTDRLTPEQRSRLMSRVKGRDTTPEMTVRRTVHALGYRYALHRRDLPGSPDLVFPARKAVIFVHGCFWHRHENCRKATVPKTRTDFWLRKFAANIERDRRDIERICNLGWRPLVVWECETKDMEALVKRIVRHLGAKHYDLES